MKKALIFVFLIIICHNLFSQESSKSSNYENKIPVGVLPEITNTNDYYNQSQSKNWLSRWYNFGEAMQLYHGTTSAWYGNFLFPDSTILVNYTGGYGSAWVHKLGDVLDVTSTVFNDANLFPNMLTIDATTKYRLDSIHFHCKYDRNIPDPNIVDTLLFEISVNDALVPSYFMPGVLSPAFTTDTVFMLRVPYAYQSNSLNLANKKIFKVPLTAQTFADSLTNGIHIIKLSTDSLPIVNAGKRVVTSITFIPGYTWVANTDILDNKNNVMFISMKERDNQFPHYIKRDFNISYILPTDVRYNLAGSWNGNFIPSYAYMGSAPTYNYEHHFIYYKISTAFKVNYETHNVSCYGGNDGYVNLTVTGGTTPYNFLWSHGATTQNVNNLTAGNYTVTITDALSDSTVRTFNITQPTMLNATITSSPASACGMSDGFIVVSNISGGTPSYSIIVLDADSITQTLTDLPAGIYTVKVTDSKGCKIVKSVAINETGAPAYTINQTDISCFGLADGTVSVNVTNPSGTPSYLWSNGQTVNSLSNLSEGAYMLTITDDNCHIFEVINITQPLPLSVNGIVQNATGGQANGTIILQVSGGTAPYSYSWSSGQQTQNIGSLAEGTYTVTVTDVNLCTYTETYSVISLGVFENLNNALVEVFPNPVSNMLNVGFKGIKDKYAYINILDTQGRLLKSEKIFIVENNINTVELFNFTQGLYFVEITIDGYKVNKKIIVK